MLIIRGSMGAGAKGPYLNDDCTGRGYPKKGIKGDCVISIQISLLTVGGGFKDAMIATSAFRLICFFQPIVRSSHFCPLVSSTV